MRQRVRQFMTASRRPTGRETVLARTHLSSDLLGLFLHQHPRDIIHAADTARFLLARGETDPDLIAAALLHDVGKGHQRRFDRVAYVVAGWLHLQARLEAGASSREWRRAMARSLHHAEAGAAAIEAAGAPPRVVELTRLHHSPAGEDGMLRALQEADSAS